MWGNVRVGEMRWGEVKWGQGRSGEGRWGEVRWGEVMWGDVFYQIRFQQIILIFLNISRKMEDIVCKEKKREKTKINLKKKIKELV